MYTLVAEQLSRSFGQGSARTTVLHEVSLSIRAGEFALLMGPSGSGKSTLLALLSGLARPDHGRVLAMQQDLWELDDLQRERFRLQHCGFIFQGYNLFPALTARQQLEMVLRWTEPISLREARLRTQKMLEDLGLGDKGGLRPSQLSGGERQRVAIARALLKRPQFCFADEPTAALDWTTGRHVAELLRNLARRNGTLLFVVAHDPRLTEFADRVFHIDGGHLVEA
jgi:putative ABC transport system ATP-binding protein